MSWGLGLLLAAGLVPSVVAQGTSAISPNRFMMDAAAGGLTEMELSRLALDKASRPEIKTLAQMLIDDHTMVNNELAELAGRKSVALPTEPSPEGRAERDRLSRLSGAAFDEAYLSAVTKGHEKSIRIFTEQSSSGTDADAKAWATKTLPKLQGHLSKVQEVARGR
jgi:putative membrane protein